MALDEKSLAVRLTLNSEEGTLTDAQIEAAVQAVVQQLGQQLGARLRA
jgi:phenylalanyl-tRNA synthetase beta chain